MKWFLAIALCLPARLALAQIYDSPAPPQDIHGDVDDSDVPATAVDVPSMPPTHDSQLPDLDTPEPSTPSNAEPMGTEPDVPELPELAPGEQAPESP